MKQASLTLSILSSLALMCGCAHTGSTVAPPPAPLVVTPSTAPQGTANSPYNLALSTTGGSAPYTWSISSGTLPSGIALDANAGLLSGTPTTTGVANFTVQVTDSSNPARTGSQAYAITVNGVLTFVTSTLPNGTQGVSYSTTPSTVGGATPFTWTIASGSLPAGLSLNSSSGAITGTPSAAGSFSVGLQITDSSVPPQTAKLFTGVVIDPALAVSTTTLASGAVAVPYSASLASTGGVNPLTWSVSAGAVPPGVNLSSAGVISGTPTAAGNSSFTVQVTDSANPPRTASAALTLTVNAHFTVQPSATPNGTVGLAYTFSPAISGGTAPYVWSVASGSLPPGLSLNPGTGAVFGTPSSSGSFSFVLQVTDSSSPAETATDPAGIVVYAPLAVSSQTLPTAAVNSSYSATLTASNAVSATTWAITAGSLPAGLSLNMSTGLIGGSSSATGTVNFTVQVTDSAVPPRTASLPLSITTVAALSIAPGTLPDGVTGTAYRASITSSGGVAPYTWSVSAGSLPFGLALSAGTGAIAGTPPGSGAFTFTAHVADSSSPPQTATASRTILIYGQLTITTTTLSDAVVGTAYTTTLEAFGGNGNYTWTISSGSLPDGITLDPSTGIISGTPTTAGPSNFSAQITDTSNPPQSASASLSLNVDASGSGDSLLKGNYAFLLQGFDSNGAVAVAGTIEADGAGAIKAGMLDVNRSAGVQTNVAIESGTYAINSDHRGTIIVHSSLGTQTFQVAVNAAGTLVRFIEFDAPGPGVIRGTGVMKLRDPASFSNPAVSGSYAFGLSGSTFAGQRSAVIGSLLTDGAGGISAGLVDVNSAGNVANALAVLPSSNYAIAGNGRGTLTLNIPALGSVIGALYVVSAKEIFFVRTDIFGGNVDLLSGNLMQQSGAPYSLSPLIGASVLHLNGSSSDSSTSIAAGLISNSENGTLTGTYDRNDNGTLTSISTAAGSYAVTSALTGRGTMSFAGNDWIFYLVDSATGFVMDDSGSSVMMGMFEEQSMGAHSPASALGSFIEGSESNTNERLTFETGVLSVALSGAFAGTIDTNSAGDILSLNNPVSGVIRSSTDGRIAPGDGKIYYILSPTRLLEMDARAGQPNPRIMIGDQ
jgi:Putative Ig domain